MHELCDEQPPSTLARACRMNELPRLLRLDRVVPVVAGVQQVHPLRQHQDVVVADIGRPGLEQAHRDVRVLRQPRGQRAARGAAAGDHIVECAGVRAIHACSSALASAMVVAACDSSVPMWWRPLTKYHSRPDPRITPM